MENYRVVNLFLEKHKTKRIEKIPGILTKTPREDKQDIYISDFGIPYLMDEKHKHETKLLLIYLHDSTQLNREVLNKQELKFFRLDCLELTKQHIEKVFLAQEDQNKKENLIKEYHNKLYDKYKKIKMEDHLPFKKTKFDIIKKLISSIK